MKLSIFILKKEQLATVLQSHAERIALSFDGISPNDWEACIGAIRKAKKEAFLAFGPITRGTEQRMLKNALNALKSASFDGFYVGNAEALQFLIAENIPGVRIADYSIPVWNSYARNYLLSHGFSGFTLSPESSLMDFPKEELSSCELPVYGRLPMMTTENCVKKTTGHCDKTPGFTYLKDRTEKCMPVYSVCAFCRNTIYNAVPLSLQGESKRLLTYPFASFRLSFTDESPAEITARLTELEKAFVFGENIPPSYIFTKAHFFTGI